MYSKKGFPTDFLRNPFFSRKLSLQTHGWEAVMSRFPGKMRLTSGWQSIWQVKLRPQQARSSYKFLWIPILFKGLFKGNSYKFLLSPQQARAVGTCFLFIALGSKACLQLYKSRIWDVGTCKIIEFTSVVISSGSSDQISPHDCSIPDESIRVGALRCSQLSLHSMISSLDALGNLPTTLFNKNTVFL